MVQNIKAYGVIIFLIFFLSGFQATQNIKETVFLLKIQEIKKTLNAIRNKNSLATCFAFIQEFVERDAMQIKRKLKELTDSDKKKFYASKASSCSKNYPNLADDLYKTDIAEMIEMDKYKSLFKETGEISYESDEEIQSIQSQIDEIWNKVKTDDMNQKVFGEAINITKNKYLNAILLFVALAIFVVFLYGIK